MFNIIYEESTDSWFLELSSTDWRCHTIAGRVSTGCADTPNGFSLLSLLLHFWSRFLPVVWEKQQKVASVWVPATWGGRPHTCRMKLLAPGVDLVHANVAVGVGSDLASGKPPSLSLPLFSITLTFKKIIIGQSEASTYSADILHGCRFESQLLCFLSSKKKAQVLGLLGPHGSPRWNSCLLASYQPSSDHCDYLGSKPGDGRCLSLSFSFSLPFK